MRRAAALLLALLCATAPAPAPALDSAAPADTATSVLARGVEAARAGRHAEAAPVLRQALARARAENAPPALVGRIAGWLAIALEATRDPEADAHYAMSVAALESDPDVANFVSIARRAIALRMASDQPERAGDIVAPMMRRIEEPNVAEETKVDAVKAAVAWFRRLGRKDEQRKALDGLADLRGESPKILSGRGEARLGRATAAYKAGRLREARQQALAARDDLRRAGDAFELAALITLGRIDFSAGAYRPAIETLEESERRLAEFGADLFDLWMEAASLRAGLLERAGRLAEAVAAGQAIVERTGAIRGEESVAAIVARLDLVRLLLAAGRRADSRDLFASVAARLGTSASPLVAGAYYEKLAALRLDEGEHARAAEAADKALAAYGQAGVETTNLRLAPSRIKAKALVAAGAGAESESALRLTIEISESALSPGHPETAADLGDYAKYLGDIGRHDEAEAVQRRVMAIVAETYGEESAQFATALFNRANTLTSLRRGEEAIDALRKAAALMRDAEGRSADHVMALLQLAAAQRAHGRPDDALRSADRAEIAGKQLGLSGLPEIRHALGVIAASSLSDLGRHDEAWAHARPLLDAEGQSAVLSQRNFGVFAVFAARIAGARRDFPEALRLARRASAVVRAAGGADRRFYDEWASDLALIAWEASR
jgi:tetratricopeptide (TPR) repeat protein